jgi:ribosome assembly protein 1
MLLLEIGNLYAVLSRRRGEVTKEDIIEGTSLFILSARLPVANSFGFAQELLKKTSGKAVTPQLMFSNWNFVPVDPFWKPTTDDELEDYGGQTLVPNVARNFINDVRRRKGLPLEEKIVVSAEKQRTLTKMK